MLKLENISLTVGTFQLKDISFSVERGDYFVVLGFSGVGKSILLESIAGLLEPSAGSISLRGKDITHMAVQKRNISIVYQDADLFPHLTVFENIAYPLHSRGAHDISSKVLQAAEQVGIAALLQRKPYTLSGGEYQRVSLARSLAAGSDLFLLDEPLSSLDSKSKKELRTVLRKLNRNGKTIIHVTHDHQEAISLASKIGILENGSIVHVGIPEDVFQHPKSEFVAHFIGVHNFLKGELRSLPQSDLKEFHSNGMTIFCLTDMEDGEAFLVIEPNEITISSTEEISSSRNHFQGTVTDISSAHVGLEITVLAGREFIAAISNEARKALALEIGKEVWINFKAASCKIYK